MIALAAIAAVLAAGAVVTFIGSRLIERAHPPRGRFIELGGLRQHIVDLGSPQSVSPPLVLLHGAGCNLEDTYLALGERLAAKRRVILIDRPGQGWSERRGAQGSSPAWQASVVRGVFDHLKISRAIVVGHSWGGTLAATFALDHPERVAGLVLIAPPTHPHLRSMTRLYTALGMPVLGWLFAHTLALPLAAASFGAGLRAAFAPQAPPDNYLKRSASFLLLRPAAFLANARDVGHLQSFLARQAPRYPTLKTPTIIVTGDSDQVVPPQQHALALAAAVPEARCVVLPGVGHMPHHAAPDRVVAAIDELAPLKM